MADYAVEKAKKALDAVDGMYKAPLFSDTPIASSVLAAMLTDETGTNKVVFSDGPSLILPTVDGIQLNITTPTTSAVEGVMRYNATENCLEIGEPNGGFLQVGQEERLFGKNRESTTIGEGKVVYVSGAAGANVELMKADADDYLQSVGTLAVTTESIAANDNGRYTTAGFVRTLNTNAWAEGTVLYLSQTAGELTATPPAYPAHKIMVAIVTRQSATVGEIYVMIRPVWRKFGDVPNGNYSGFEDDGTLIANGGATTFDDALGQLIGEKLESPSSRITLDVAEGTVVYGTNTTLADYVFVGPQFTHKMKAGSNVYPHLHWFQAQANTPNWMIQYRWQRNGQEKTTAWTNLKMQTNAFTYVSGTLNQISYTTAITPPTGYSISDTLQCRVIRDTANASTLFTGADAYTVAVHATNFDVHIECDTLGSRTEYSK